MQPTMDTVVAKYIELRDQKAEVADRHKAELEPINTSMEKIEQWLLGKMSELGVDSVKTPSGTPYKSTTTSVKMADAKEFKKFIFTPVIKSLIELVEANGFLTEDLLETVLASSPKWDMVDFRPGKKGIGEFIASTDQVPPGVEISSFTTVNVRRA
jgi:hypothetical protein